VSQKFVKREKEEEEEIERRNAERESVFYYT